jgi:AcrR family transcriptional regulator
MPPRPTKEDVLTAYRQSAFLQAAIRVFGACGFERATMDRIAHEADVAKGTIYLYYKSKQAIYEAALRSGFADLDERTRLRMEEARTLREVIASFIANRAEYFTEHPDFFRMYVAAIAAQIITISPRPADVHGMVERQTRRLEQVLERAVARREIRRVDPAATALAIFDVTRGLVARRLATRSDPDVSADAAFLADLIWRGLRRNTVMTGPGAHKRPNPRSPAGGSKRKR